MDRIRVTIEDHTDDECLYPDVTSRCAGELPLALRMAIDASGWDEPGTYIEILRSAEEWDRRFAKSGSYVYRRLGENLASQEDHEAWLDEAVNFA